MHVFKRAGLSLQVLALTLALTACAGSANPTPTETLPPTFTPAPTFTLPPTWTPVGKIVVTARNELTLRAGPSAFYAAVGVMPAGHEATVFGRDQHNHWARVQYGTLTGWVSLEQPDSAEVAGDLNTLPIVPAPPITDTPPPPTTTNTPYPTFTPRPTRTRAPTETPAPTPDDRDSRAMPVYTFGVLGITFEETGGGILALPEDEYDYIALQFDPAISGQITVEMEFTCDNPDAELLLTLFSAQRRREELQHIYPVCNQGPVYFRALESGAFYQVQVWLRRVDMPFVVFTPTPITPEAEAATEATPEATATPTEESSTLEPPPDRLELRYSFTIRNPRPR